MKGWSMWEVVGMVDPNRVPLTPGTILMSREDYEDIKAWANSPEGDDMVTHWEQALYKGLGLDPPRGPVRLAPFDPLW